MTSTSTRCTHDVRTSSRSWRSGDAQLALASAVEDVAIEHERREHARQDGLAVDGGAALDPVLPTRALDDPGLGEDRLADRHGRHEADLGGAEHHERVVDGEHR